MTSHCAPCFDVSSNGNNSGNKLDAKTASAGSAESQEDIRARNKKLAKERQAALLQNFKQKQQDFRVKAAPTGVAAQERGPPADSIHECVICFQRNASSIQVGARNRCDR